MAPSRIVTFEYYSSATWKESEDDDSPPEPSTEYYHFTMTFYEDNPGYIRMNYYQVTDRGISATVGVQRISPELPDQFLQFSCNEAVVNENSYVIFDTEAGTMSSGSL